MDWENERYVRIYTRETIDDAVLSWEARALWAELMKRFDRAGVIDTGDHGWKGVALLVRMPVAVVEKAGVELLDDGRVENRQGYLIAPNYIPAQEAKQSDKQRQAESRARKRDQVMALMLGVGEDKRETLLLTESVTDCDDLSQNVTETAESVTARHTPSHPVTPSLAVPSLARSFLSEASPPDPDEVPVSGEDLRPETEDETPPPEPPQPATSPPVPDKALRAADYLRNRILQRTPTAKASRLHWDTPKGHRAKWARTLDLLNRKDGAAWIEMRRSIDWLFDTENLFVVESAEALRKKWDSIQANRRRSSGRATTPTNRVADQWGDEDDRANVIEAQRLQEQNR